MKLKVICIITLLSISSLVAQPLKLVTFEYPPYEYTKDGKVTGMAVDIVKLVFKDMNQPISIEVLPWSEGINYIKDGKRDGIFTAFKNPEREKFADYSDVLIPQIISFFVRKDSGIVYTNNLDDLSSLNVGVVRGFSYGKLFDESLQNKTYKSIKIANNADEVFKLLTSGEVDIIPFNKYGGLHILKNQNKLGEVKELSKKLKMVSSYMAFSKKNNHSKTRDDFNKSLKKIKSQGEYRKIIKSYFSK